MIAALLELQKHPTMDIYLKVVEVSNLIDKFQQQLDQYTTIESINLDSKSNQIDQQEYLDAVTGDKDSHTMDYMGTEDCKPDGEMTQDLTKSPPN